MGGVLFIDEAYYLYSQDNERDYEILLQVMENSDDLVVIVAGYAIGWTTSSGEPGLRSCIAHHVDFPDYTEAELMAIADPMLAARTTA